MNRTPDMNKIIFFIEYHHRSKKKAQTMTIIVEKQIARLVLQISSHLEVIFKLHTWSITYYNYTINIHFSTGSVSEYNFI